MIFHWVAVLLLAAVVGLDLLPVAPQPTVANLLWLAIIFLTLEETK